VTAFLRSFFDGRMTRIGRRLPAVRFRNLAQQQADGAICVSASPTSRATRPRDADIPRRLRIRSRHHRKRSITDGIVNTRPDVGGLGRRPSPRVHDGLESAFTLGRIGTYTCRRQMSGSEEGLPRVCHESQSMRNLGNQGKTGKNPAPKFPGRFRGLGSRSVADSSMW
jgi:hypothetical protein